MDTNNHQHHHDDHEEKKKTKRKYKEPITTMMFGLDYRSLALMRVLIASLLLVDLYVCKIVYKFQKFY